MPDRDTADMLAVEISQSGPPEVLKPVRRPRPHPGAGEVLIRVAAAGVNRPDVLQRKGLYPPPDGASDLPGLEVSGEIVAVSPGVEWPRVGNAVCALVNGGGYAEYVSAPAVQCLPVPAGLSLVEAAALPETCFTVWANVFQQCALQPKEVFLVHGGASGIGTTAIQICTAMGARVFATASTDEKCATCVSLGAEYAINYNKADFVEEILSRTCGADVILDMVGGDYTARNLKLLRRKGRMSQIYFLRGSRVQIDLTDILSKQLVVTGGTLRVRSREDKRVLATALKENVWPIIERGDFKPLIHEVFPLAQASDAHRFMESDKHIGKIVLNAG